MQSGGPGWGVLLGRLDGKTSDFNGSLDLPAPFENLTVLQRTFKDVGLNDVDFVALSGVSRRTAASAGEQSTMGGEQEHTNKLNANTVGFWCCQGRSVFWDCIAIYWITRQ